MPLWCRVRDKVFCIDRDSANQKSIDIQKEELIDSMKDPRNGSLYWFCLDMNSGWRTSGLKGRTKVAEGLRYSRLQLVLDMTHKSTKRRVSSRCLI
ncbi:hypothetical protein F2Q68_00044113 [Brassica cretica]|uniref:Uncharacterized protein n=1 Tax=Brassica cretica TaxID=69181 RepID=A0A8S9LK43_BRACR|nr:hypothetical protein F2Q68_00044113 [Brassica cretica]